MGTVSGSLQDWLEKLQKNNFDFKKIDSIENAHGFSMIETVLWDTEHGIKANEWFHIKGEPGRTLNETETKLKKIVDEFKKRETEVRKHFGNKIPPEKYAEYDAELIKVTNKFLVEVVDKLPAEELKNFNEGITSAIKDYVRENERKNKELSDANAKKSYGPDTLPMPKVVPGKKGRD